MSEKFRSSETALMHFTANYFLFSFDSGLDTQEPHLPHNKSFF
jgi:hypothetical protein